MSILNIAFVFDAGTAEQGRLGGLWPTHFLATNGFIFDGKVLKIISA